ncbi:MAG: glycosyltransferase, partial [Maritimibacter sp.]
MSGKLIAFLVSHSSAGGAQEIWANLAEGFQARGYETRLMALYPYRDARLLLAGMEWHHVVARRPTTPLAQLDMLKSLVDFFRTEKPARVFTAMPAANVLAALAGRLAGQQSVVISHHSPIETHNPVLNLADSLTGSLRSVEGVVSVSDTVSASLDGKPKPYQRKRKTIHNALPPRIESHL